MRVAIVLVNFNGHFDTIECIESVLKSTYSNFQLIVIDNSQESNSLDFIVSYLAGNTTHKFDIPSFNLVGPLLPKLHDFNLMGQAELEGLTQRPNEKVILIRAERNLGFAGGNNIALKYFLKFNCFEYVWLLNNDTVIEPDTLSNLVLFTAQSNERIGIVGSKLFDYYNPDILQAVGGRYYKWIGKIVEVGAGQSDKRQWDEITFKIDYVVGASMFVKRKFIESVGCMNEDYFLYYEELDWAIRGRRTGWELGFCPQSRVYHKMGSSINKESDKGNSELSDFYSSRNRVLIAWKYFPYTLITLYPAFLKFIYNRLRVKQYDRILMLLKILLHPKAHFTKFR
jgi:GT2 family glycosyltransferase